jgi:hypothetical protein
VTTLDIACTSQAKPSVPDGDEYQARAEIDEG